MQEVRLFISMHVFYSKLSDTQLAPLCWSHVNQISLTKFFFFSCLKKCNKDELKISKFEIKVFGYQRNGKEFDVFDL